MYIHTYITYYKKCGQNNVNESSFSQHPMGVPLVGSMGKATKAPTILRYLNLENS